MPGDQDEAAALGLPEQLMAAAENVDAVPRLELQTLLRTAAFTIRDLRKIVQVSHAILAEDHKPDEEA